MKNKELMKSVVENALDFLNTAIDSLEESPKLSIINFYTAVELILKARLLHEHWSLVVSQKPDWASFATGDFVSVTFKDACDRLERVALSGVPDRAKKVFEQVRQHRNRLVHFFFAPTDTAKTIEAAAVEQLAAWYELNLLVTQNWKDVFQEWHADFTKIEGRLKRHHDYLSAKFGVLKPDLDKLALAGTEIETCDLCRMPAAPVQEELDAVKDCKCLVCGFFSKRFDLECPKCSETTRLSAHEDFVCSKCKHSIKSEQLAGVIDESEVTKDNIMDHHLPANCGECSGYHTVVLYSDNLLCSTCFDVSPEDSLTFCGFCSEATTQPLGDDSYYSGCDHCDGKAGWDAGKDD